MKVARDLLQVQALAVWRQELGQPQIKNCGDLESSEKPMSHCRMEKLWNWPCRKHCLVPQSHPAKLAQHIDWQYFWSRIWGHRAAYGTRPARQKQIPGTKHTVLRLVQCLTWTTGWQTYMVSRFSTKGICTRRRKVWIDSKGTNTFRDGICCSRLHLLCETSPTWSTCQESSETLAIELGYYIIFTKVRQGVQFVASAVQGHSHILLAKTARKFRFEFLIQYTNNIQYSQGGHRGKSDWWTRRRGQKVRCGLKRQGQGKKCQPWHFDHCDSVWWVLISNNLQ